MVRARGVAVSTDEAAFACLRAAGSLTGHVLLTCLWPRGWGPLLYKVVERIKSIISFKAFRTVSGPQATPGKFRLITIFVLCTYLLKCERSPEYTWNCRKK